MSHRVYIRTGRNDRAPAGLSFATTTCLLVLAAWLSACEVRPLDPETGQAIIEEQQAKFDADTFVEENWSERILPALRSEPVYIDTVLTRLDATDEERLAELQSDTRVVSGTGRVVELDDESRARLLRVDSPPYDGRSDYALQIGPVIRGTALRDAVPFISFDQFVNQLEYAGVARSLNERLVNEVLSGIDAESLVGEEITFIGVLPLRNPDARMITPVEIQAAGGGPEA